MIFGVRSWVSWESPALATLTILLFHWAIPQSSKCKPHWVIESVGVSRSGAVRLLIPFGLMEIARVPLTRITAVLGFRSAPLFSDIMATGQGTVVSKSSRKML
jgi:hypothetical protein